MFQTYTQIHLHIVLIVKERKSLIKESFRVRLEKYITGLIQKRGHKLLSIYCMPDHAHILIGKLPNQSEWELIEELKTVSERFINGYALSKSTFSWQVGFGCFSVSKSGVSQTINYIENQPEHHQKVNFQSEFIEILKSYGITPNDELFIDYPPIESSQ